MKKILSAIAFAALSFALFGSHKYTGGESLELLKYIEYCTDNPGIAIYANEENEQSSIRFTNVKIQHRYIVNRYFANEEIAKDRRYYANALNHGDDKWSASFRANTRSTCENSALLSGLDLSPVKHFVCDKLSDKCAVNIEGDIWLYSTNYAVLFSGGEPSLIFRTPCILNDDLHDYSFTTSDVEFEDHAVYAVTSQNFKSPILYDFPVIEEN